MSQLFWFELPNAPTMGTNLCRIEDIPDGGAKMMSFDRINDESTQVDKPPFSLLMLRSEKDVIAYVNRCAHFGVPLSKLPEHLIINPHHSISCNVHYARYRWHDGYCEWGDCEGESLINIPLEIGDDGQITIAT